MSFSFLKVRVYDARSQVLWIMSWSKSRRQRDMHVFLGLQSHHQWHTYSSKPISLNSSEQFHQLRTKYSNMNLWEHFHACHHRFTVPWTLNLLYYSCGMLNNQNTLSGLQGKSPRTKFRDVKRVGMSYSFFFLFKKFFCQKAQQGTNFRVM